MNFFPILHEPDATDRRKLPVGNNVHLSMREFETFLEALGDRPGAEMHEPGLRSTIPLGFFSCSCSLAGIFGCDGLDVLFLLFSVLFGHLLQTLQLAGSSLVAQMQQCVLRSPSFQVGS